MGNDRSFSLKEMGKINSIEDLLKSIKILKDNDGFKYTKFWYRGDSNKEWECIPSISHKDKYKYNGKCMKNGFDLQQERNLLHRFRRRAYPHIGHILNEWEALFLARHHGLPTRVLDWTANPLVAFYFACSCSEHLDKTAKIWGIGRIEDESNDLDMLALTKSNDDKNSPFKRYGWYGDKLQFKGDLDKKEILKNLEEEFKKNEIEMKNQKIRACKKKKIWLIVNNGNKYIILEENEKLNIYLYKEPSNLRNTEDAVKIIHPFYNSPRIINQDGIFTFHSNPRRSLESYKGIEFKRERLDIKVLISWDIEAGAKKEIIEQLENLGINRRTIYPDLDGIAQGLWESEVLWHGGEKKEIEENNDCCIYYIMKKICRTLKFGGK